MHFNSAERASHEIKAGCFENIADSNTVTFSHIVNKTIHTVNSVDSKRSFVEQTISYGRREKKEESANRHTSSVRTRLKVFGCTHAKRSATQNFIEIFFVLAVI